MICRSWRKKKEENLYKFKKLLREKELYCSL